jgi:hypothetical protein
MNYTKLKKDELVALLGQRDREIVSLNERIIKMNNALIDARAVPQTTSRFMSNPLALKARAHSIETGETTRFINNCVEAYRQGEWVAV